jgi:hypothetical protein
MAMQSRTGFAPPRSGRPGGPAENCRCDKRSEPPAEAASPPRSASEPTLPIDRRSISLGVMPNGFTPGMVPGQDVCETG